MPIETAMPEATSAVTALSTKAVVNADSAGIEVEPIVCAVSSAAPTWPPITAPIMRTTVFIPLGDAHLARVHVVGDQRRHRREGGADAEPEQPAGDEDVPGLVVGDREQQRREADHEHAAGERPLRAEAVPDHPGDGPAKSIASELGSR